MQYHRNNRTDLHQHFSACAHNPREKENYPYALPPKFALLLLLSFVNVHWVRLWYTKRQTHNRMIELG